MGRRRAACVLLLLQVHSPLEPRQGIQDGVGGHSPPAPQGRSSGTQRPSAQRRTQSQGSRASRASREAFSSRIKDAHCTWARRPPRTPAPTRPPLCSPFRPLLGRIRPEPACRRPQHSPVASPTTQRPQPALGRRRRLPPLPHGLRVASSRSLRPARPAQEEGDSAANSPPLSCTHILHPAPRRHFPTLEAEALASPASLHLFPCAVDPGKLLSPRTCQPLLQARCPQHAPPPAFRDPTSSLPIGRGKGRVCPTLKTNLGAAAAFETCWDSGDSLFLR